MVISNKDLLSRLQHLEAQLSELEMAISQTVNEEARRLRKIQLSNIVKLEKEVEYQLNKLSALYKIS